MKMCPERAYVDECLFVDFKVAYPNYLKFREDLGWLG